MAKSEKISAVVVSIHRHMHILVHINANAGAEVSSIANNSFLTKKSFYLYHFVNASCTRICNKNMDSCLRFIC